MAPTNFIVLPAFPPADEMSSSIYPWQFCRYCGYCSITEPLNATTWLSNSASSLASGLFRYWTSASFLKRQRAKRDAATMALERRDMKEARLRIKAMSVVVGSVGEGCREMNNLREGSSDDDMSLIEQSVKLSASRTTRRDGQHARFYY